MQFSWTRVAFFILSILFFGSVGYAQQQDRYVPDPMPYIPDPLKFLKQSDKHVYDKVKETMKRFDDNKHIGEDIAEKYGMDGDNWDDDKYVTHPWREMIGRNPIESYLDWFKDSAVTVIDPIPMAFTFFKCLEPTIPIGIEVIGDWLKCEWQCPPIFDDGNYGVLVEWWWPENHIETNNFAVAAYNPLFSDPPRIDLLPPILTLLKDFILVLPVWAKLSIMSQEAIPFELMFDFPEELRKDPHIGQTHWAGLTPVDQTLYQEAHAYRAYLPIYMADMAEEQSTSDGFLVNDGCFFLNFKGENGKGDNKRETVNGWTESWPFVLFWRLPEFSAFVDEELYLASVPIALLVENFAVGVGLEALLEFTSFAGPCTMYRAAKWKEPYQDLVTALYMPPGDKNDEKLEKICYKGGGDLYPLVGNLMGHFAPLTAEAYLARRAIELFSTDKEFLGEPLNPPERRLPTYTDETDKMQRVYPRQNEDQRYGTSECFRMNEVPNYVEMHDDERFPLDLVREEHLGSVRHNLWNRRLSCHCTRWLNPFASGPACKTYDRGLDKNDKAVGGIPLWFLSWLGFPVHGINWPFNPLFFIFAGQ